MLRLGVVLNFFVVCLQVQRTCGLGSSRSNTMLCNLQVESFWDDVEPKGQVVFYSRITFLSPQKNRPQPTLVNPELREGKNSKPTPHTKALNAPISKPENPYQYHQALKPYLNGQGT